MTVRRRQPSVVSAQRGSFLLEALIALLIVLIGILGLIGLQARSIQNVQDAQYRAEAAYLASALIGQMWADSKNWDTLQAKYEGSAGAGGPGYTEFTNMVTKRLPGANAGGVPAPDVAFSAKPASATAVQSPEVSITISWQPPGDTSMQAHRYEITTRIGRN
jgi:type IV pilus assembly protein PilV